MKLLAHLGIRSREELPEFESVKAQFDASAEEVSAENEEKEQTA
jgi:hypothetical protein